MKKFLAIFIACVAILGLAYLVARYYLPIYGVQTPMSQTGYARTQVSLGGARYDALVSDTEALRARGLSGRPHLEDGQAMLFIFPNEGDWGFWMKDMLFPIDMIWIDNDLRVVTVKANAQPSSYPDVFYPTAPARYVLEISAGDAAKFDIGPGGKVTF
ncbi:MAG TPA: DUF192 domain-containing protein [Candidatus Paceibacterota bacterium]|jgi:Uncharacterized conserved protein